MCYDCCTGFFFPILIERFMMKSSDLFRFESQVYVRLIDDRNAQGRLIGMDAWGIIVAADAGSYTLYPWPNVLSVGYNKADN